MLCCAYANGFLIKINGFYVTLNIRRQTRILYKKHDIRRWMHQHFHSMKFPFLKKHQINKNLDPMKNKNVCMVFTTKSQHFHRLNKWATVILISSYHCNLPTPWLLLLLLLPYFYTRILPTRVFVRMINVETGMKCKKRVSVCNINMNNIMHPRSNKQS